MRDVTLCFLLRDDEICLAMKKRGFGVGKWNGIGGKVQDGETIEEAAVRELYEEVGVRADIADLKNVGNIKFYFNERPDWNQRMHVYFVNFSISSRHILFRSFLSAIFTSAPLSPIHTFCVQYSPDNMVSNARKIFYSTASN